MTQILPRTGPPYCIVCEGPCREEFHRGWYVFPDRRPPPPPPTFPAPHAVEVDERIKYAPGDLIPWHEAVALGLVQGDPPKEPVPRKRGKRKSKRARRPTEDRARKPSEDRAK